MNSRDNPKHRIVQEYRYTISCGNSNTHTFLVCNESVRTFKIFFLTSQRHRQEVAGYYFALGFMNLVRINQIGGWNTQQAAQGLPIPTDVVIIISTVLINIEGGIATFATTTSTCCTESYDMRSHVVICQLGNHIHINILNIENLAVLFV
jgi:phosphatidylserine synthase